MFEKINQQHWIALDKKVRQHLAKVFGLVPTGIAEIRDQTVVSDGYTNSDLERINGTKMSEYVGGGAETFARLWELTLAKVKYELNPPIDLNPPSALSQSPVEDLKNIPASIITTAEADKPFCTQCDSKGGRHKKICPLSINA